MKNVKMNNLLQLKKVQIIFLPILSGLFFSSTATFANHPLDSNSNKDSYRGNWYNKETNRHLQINFDDSLNYMDVNDWVGNRKKANIDLYKAFFENGILILPAYNNELHTCYCEIKWMNNCLEYTCNEAFNFKGNYLNLDNPLRTFIFHRVK